MLFTYITVFTKPRQVSRPVTLFFFVLQQSTSGAGHLFLDHPQLDKNTLGRTPLKERSARSSDRYLHKTAQTQQTNTHALSGIRTRHPSNQATADLLNFVVL
jgi:hypothetical protein